jgi:anti-sigma B factor antagonist
MELKIKTRSAGGVVIVSLSGRMVLGEETKMVTHILRELISDRPQVVLDLNGLRAVDPSGIGALLSLYTSAAHAGGRVRLARPSSKLAAMLSSTKLASIFPIYDSAEEAVAAFTPAPAT